MVRIFDFPSCWNGKAVNSADHRAHIVYPGPTGACAGGTFPVPQLHVEVAYSLEPGSRYTVDSFAGESHSPIADHADFSGVMPDALMTTAVDCINTGRTCTS